MTNVILLFFGALVIAVALTPISKWLAPHVGVMAMPRARDMHTKPVPRMGGVAIFIGVMAVATLLADRAFVQEAAAILFGAALMSFLGLLDDRFSLSAYVRLAVQVGTALLMYYAGVRIQVFNNIALDAVLTVLWIAGITNAMNMIDNMDGLLAGVSAVISSFMLLLAIINGQYLVSLLSAAVLGACIGFLVWNLNPANVFMGDSGSMFLGFLLAVIAVKLRFLGQSLSVSWLIPLLVMGVPLFDITLVFISRLRRGKNPLTTPGKDHTSHRIHQHGFTQREAVLVLYLVSGALGVIAVLSSFSDIFANMLIATAVLCLALFMLWFMEFGPWKINPQTQPPLPNPPQTPPSVPLPEPTNASQSLG